jgi:uncharacterized protein YkwD
MFGTLIASLALVLSNPSVSGKVLLPVPGEVIAGVPAVAVAPVVDPEAERRFLSLANQARQEAGLSALQNDQGLTEAARNHAVLMARQRQLSHQFSGESSLASRLAEIAGLHLDLAGENVALGQSIELTHDSLMKSQPHRENLLNAGFNVTGIGVVRSGEILYVVQDFGHSLPQYSEDVSEELIAKTLSKEREHAKLPALQRKQEAAVRSSACSMAQQDSIHNPAAGPAGRYILRYTAMQPNSLPISAAKVVSDSSVQSYSAGTCYARTTKYPNGAYWVTLVFY